MNILDIILVVPIIWLMYRGYQKGFIIELSSLVALILGIYLAINFSGYASDFLTRNFNISDKYLNILAFIVTFMVVVFGVYMVGKILEQFINILLLGFINKIAGAAFGVIKAAFLISVVLWIINSFDMSRTVIKDSLRQGSILYEPIEQFAPSVIPKLSLDKFKSFEFKVKDEFNNIKI